MKKLPIGDSSTPPACTLGDAARPLAYSPFIHTAPCTLLLTSAKCGATSASRARTPPRLSYGSGAPSTSDSARTIFQSSRASPTAGTAVRPALLRVRGARQHDVCPRRTLVAMVALVHDKRAVGHLGRRVVIRAQQVDKLGGRRRARGRARLEANVERGDRRRGLVDDVETVPVGLDDARLFDEPMNRRQHGIAVGTPQHTRTNNHERLLGRLEPLEERRRARHKLRERRHVGAEMGVLRAGRMGGGLPGRWWQVKQAVTGQAKGVWASSVDVEYQHL
eukprot:138723-Chlamydomonas_euryale.AAC.2